MAVLTEADIIQENSGSSSATTNHVVTLGSGTTAGNTLIVFTGPAGLLTAPAGFSLDAGGGAGTMSVYRKPEVAAGETSWTFTTGAADSIPWHVEEVSNIDPVEPLDVTASNSASVAVSGTLSTGTTAQNAGLSVVAYAMFGSVTAATWGGYTNDYTEAADVTSASNLSLAVARKFQSGTTSTFSSTATKDTGSTATAQGRVLVYRAMDAPLAAPLTLILGFEWGTHAGMGNSGASNPQQGVLGAQGTWGTNYLVQASSARNSGYGLRLAPSASVAYLTTGNASLTSSGSASFGVDARVVSGSGVVVVARFVPASGTTLELVYDVSNTKFGLRWGTGGTPSYQSGTTALNTWVWVDVRLRVNSATWHADWTLETGTNTYTAQTSPADLTGQTGTSMNTTNPIYLGTSASQTMTAEYDNMVLSRYYAAYPWGAHQVRLLTVDTGGTPSVSGTAANFNVFTANGTLAAWNAANARDAVDEVPPTLSASSDGVVQVTAAASDYMEFPMADPALAADEVLGAARYVGAMWGGTGTGTGQLGIKVFDGATETIVDPGTTSYDADSLTAASSSYPLWRQGMITPPAGGWNPTRGKALVSRIGYSPDATPDMGTSAFYIEYATRKAQTVRQFTLEDPISATADILVNPYTSGSVSYLITNNDAVRSVNFNYDLLGTPQTPVPVGPSFSRQVVVNADNFGDVGNVSLEAI